MLITSNTIPPILDNNGKPLVNGRLYVYEDDTEDSKLAELFSSINFEESNSVTNPITLNGAGEIPNPVWAKTSAQVLWCFAYNESKELKRQYPLASIGVFAGDNVYDNEDTGVFSLDNLIVKNRTKTKDLDVENDLDVGNNLKVKSGFLLNQGSYDFDEAFAEIRGRLIVMGQAAFHRNVAIEGQLTFGSIEFNGLTIDSSARLSSFVPMLDVGSPLLDLQAFPPGSYAILKCDVYRGINDFLTIVSYDYAESVFEAIAYENEWDYIGERVGTFRSCGEISDKRYLCVRIN